VQVYLRLKRHVDRQRTRTVIDRAKNLDGESLRKILGTVRRTCVASVACMKGPPLQNQHHNTVLPRIHALSPVLSHQASPLSSPRPCHGLALSGNAASSNYRSRTRLPLQKQLPSWVNFPDFEKVSWVNSVIGAALRTCLRRRDMVDMRPHPVGCGSTMSHVDRVTQHTVCVDSPSAGTQRTLPGISLVSCQSPEHVLAVLTRLVRVLPPQRSCGRGCRRRRRRSRSASCSHCWTPASRCGSTRSASRSAPLFESLLRS